jgi:uncharacterized phage protein (TIGR01671 family)
MRDILFRGKTKAGEWVEGYLFIQAKGTEYEQSFILGDLDHRDSIYDVWKCAEEVIPETVGQFTGKLDKNGRKIFEGDLVWAMMDYGPGGFHSRMVTIGWHEDRGYQWEYFDMSTIEVIGAAYEVLAKGE